MTTRGPRSPTPILALAAVVLASGPLGCGSGGASAAAAETGAGDAEEDTAPAPPPLDPKLFDCTSLAKGPPPRRSSTTPECLRDPKCKTRLVSGHRGAGGDLGRIAPEDTLAAYRAGIAMGIDLVETDPRPTKDGVLVNVHDPDLDRTTTGKGPVDQHTLAEIKALSIKTGELQGDFSCERVPTLKELLELCRGRAMVLVDANKTSRVDLLVADMKAAGALEWAVFDTSDLSKIDAALAIEPTLLIMPRIEAEADAPGILAKYKDHLPVFVEIDSKIFPKAADLVHAAGTRTFTDAFGTDVGVKLGGPVSRYTDLFGQGGDVLQSDLPDMVLKALGRPVPPP